MVCKILVPSGIGDFSWLWSKLVTTQDQYDIEYIGGIPDRMTAFLALLPQDRVVSVRSNSEYYTKWDSNGELICIPRKTGMAPILKARGYADVLSGNRVFLETNTHLERGNRLEEWFKNELPNTEFHYAMRGILDKATIAPYFIVNFSSYGTKKAWGYYEVEDSVKLVKFIYKERGWLPVFIGGPYDDYTIDICKALTAKNIPVINMVGRTPDLTTVVALLQQSELYFGACSGLMALANVLHVPVCTYYPPFKNPPGRYLAGTWHDPLIPYLSLFWEGVPGDKKALKEFFKGF